MEILLKYGKKRIGFSTDGFPDTKIITPGVPAPIDEDNLRDEFSKAIESPIGGPRLKDIAKRGGKWAIVVSDRTRCYGFDEWGGFLIDALNSCGVADRDITIVFATGAHSGQTPEEMRRIVGEGLASRIRLVDHDCDNADSHVRAGMTSRGTPVEVDRVVAEADRVCITGVVQHHYYAGFTGGRKAIMPGVCSRTGIFANHSLNLYPDGGTHPRARTGVLDGNPIHEDMVEAAGIAGPDFCINVAANSAGRPYAFFAGDFVDAHDAACRWVAGRYESFCEPSSVVIAGAGGAPKDASFYQAHKAFDNAFRALLPGGTLILAAECGEGLGPAGFLDWFNMPSLDHIEKKLREKYIVPGHTALRALEKANAAKVVLVTGLSPDIVGNLHCIHAANIDDALRITVDDISRADRINIIPDAGVTVPKLPYGNI